MSTDKPSIHSTILRFSKQRRLLRLMACFLPLIMSNSCCHTKSDSVALVYVSRPQVYTRERLVNQRLADVQWMQGQLKTDPSPSIQGHFSTQTLSSFQELASATVTPTATPSAPTATAPTSNTAGITSLPSLTGGTASTTASSTGVEAFNDLKARRDAINGAILNESLDDSHDILGNTLYILKFDITVAPGQNANRALFIQFSLGNPFLNPDGSAIDGSAIPYENQKIMYESWREALRTRASEEAEAMEYRDWANQLNPGEYSEMRANLARAYAVADYRIHPNHSKSFNPAPPETKNPEDLRKAFELDEVLQLAVNAATPQESAPVSDAVRWRGLKSAPSNLPADPAKAKVLASKREFAFEDAVSVAAKYSFGRFIDDARLVVAKRGDSDVYGIGLLADDDSDPSNSTETRAKNFYNAVLTESYMKSQAGILGASAYVTAVDPAEYVQNISNVAATEDVLNLALSLSAALGHSGNAQSTTNYVHASEQMMDSILRNPLVVGFTDGPTTFGWLLGPRFELNAKGGTPKFVQSDNNYTMTATVVVPGWWPRISIKRECLWLRRDGTAEPVSTRPRDDTSGVDGVYSDSTALEKGTTSGDESWSNGTSIPIDLPADWSKLLDFEVGGDDRSVHRPVIKAAVDSNLNRIPLTAVREGQTNATILIRGDDLWRNPTVYLGSQMADSVQVLPDMKGLLATFGVVAEPTSLNADRTVDLTVTTSSGSDTIYEGVEVRTPKTANTAGFATLPTSNFVVAGERITFNLDSTKFPVGYSSFSVQLKPALVNEAVTITDPDPVVSANGSSIALALSPSSSNAPSWWSIPQEVSVDLQLKMHPFDVPASVLTGTPHNLVFFTADSQTQLILSPATLTFDRTAATKSNPNALIITLPSNLARILFTDAYPGLSAALAAIPCTANVVLADSAGALGSYKLQVTVTSGGALVVSSATLLNALPVNSVAPGVFDKLSVEFGSSGIVPIAGSLTVK